MTGYLKFSILAVAFCALGATICAVVRSESSPRLATAMRFFALSWAVLIPFYALQPHIKTVKGLGVIAEFLPTYAGVLLVLTAEPLWREARDRSAMMGGALRFIDLTTAHCLFALIFPYLAALFPEGPEHVAAMRFLDLMLAGVGFICIAVVLRLLITDPRKNGLWRGFVFLSVVYFGTQGWWWVDLVLNPEHAEMKNPFIIGFALLKLALSAVFLTLVMSVRNSKDARPDKGKPAGATA